MIDVENTDVNIVRNLIPMRNHMPASAYDLKAISDWLLFEFQSCVKMFLIVKVVSSVMVSLIIKNFLYVPSRETTDQNKIRKA